MYATVHGIPATHSGILATTLGAANAISLDAISFLISAGILLSIPRAFNPPASPQPTDGSVLNRILGDIREGLVFLWQHQLIRTLTLLGFGNSFSAGAVIGLTVVYAVQGLGLATALVREP
jgi:hypothetical protein